MLFSAVIRNLVCLYKMVTYKKGGGGIEKGGRRHCLGGCRRQASRADCGTKDLGQVSSGSPQSSLLSWVCSTYTLVVGHFSPLHCTVSFQMYTQIVCQIRGMCKLGLLSAHACLGSAHPTLFLSWSAHACLVCSA